MQGGLACDLKLFEWQAVSLCDLAQVAEINFAIIDSFCMWLLSFLIDKRQVKDAWVDLQLVDELSFLVDKLLLKLALFWIVKLL